MKITKLKITIALILGLILILTMLIINGLRNIELKEYCASQSSSQGGVESCIEYYKNNPTELLGDN